MIIKPASSLPWVGAAGLGQYIQSSSNAPSLRTKRNGGLRGRGFADAQNGFVQNLGVVWNGISTADKNSFFNYGLSNPAFASWNRLEPSFSYRVFLALNSKLALAGYSVITSVSTYFPQPENYLSVSSIGWNPFTITGSQVPGSTGQSVLFFVQLNLSVTASPAARNLRMCFARPGRGSSISGFQAAVLAQYSQSVNYTSISVRLDRINSNGRVFEPGPLLTFPFS